MVRKCLVTDKPNLGPFYPNHSNKLLLKANLKEILGNGFAVTVHAGYLKFMFQILDFYNAKTCLCMYACYIHICIYVQYINIYVPIQVYIWYICIYINVHVCVYVCMYVSKYLYTHKNFEIAENAFLSTIYLICTFKSNEAII